MRETSSSKADLERDDHDKLSPRDTGHVQQVGPDDVSVLIGGRHPTSTQRGAALPAPGS